MQAESSIKNQWSDDDCQSVAQQVVAATRFRRHDDPEFGGHIRALLIDRRKVLRRFNTHKLALTRRTVLLVLATCALLAPPAFSDRIESTSIPIEQLIEQVQQLKAEVAELKSQMAVQNDGPATEETAPTTPKVTLGPSGFRVQSPDGAFDFKLRLRLAHDFAWFRQDEELKRAIGDEQDGTDFRWARIRLEGKVWSDIAYLAEFDFAGQSGEDTPKFRDVYLQYNGIPYGGGRAFDLRIGHFKEPFSLDELNAISDRQFVENPLLDGFVPTRNVGVQASDALLGEPERERLTWTFGVFKETDDVPSSNDSDEDQGYQLTARVTGLPYYARDGRRLLHLGAAYSRRNPDGARLAYGLRPESRLSLFRYIDPDNLPMSFRLRDARADNVDLFGAELAGVFGPFSFQSEYVWSDVDTTFGGDLRFDGYYVQAAYLVTGEHRPYRHDAARFTSPVPKRPFKLRGEGQGPGAWEMAARYGAVDLSDGPVRGGEHASLTLGVNWYLNPNVRVTWNYIHNQIQHDRYDGQFDIFQSRVQLEF